ncbi:Dehydrogenase [Apostichopus japonicus]|uniref:3-oxoacyl-[acyl-carrier-protein] reductase n=1 Tax=Stichopus japonicus TaxID=307972 RepID=A0A2G8LF05_STIJA|nr:Dehydrogenase [Apostichopus japonicus]
MLTTIAGHGNISVHSLEADLQRPEEVHTLCKEALKLHPKGIDILVNNAGAQYVVPVEDFPLEKWNLLMNVNLTSAFLLIKYLLPKMKENDWGRIINVASAHGLVASVNKSAYCAAKHGLIGLTKVVALETIKTGVTCNAICPGWVLTELVQKQLDDITREKNISIGEAQEVLFQHMPSGKCTTPEEIGELVAYLCSGGSGNIRGSSISIDGGWVAQ